MSLRTAGRHAGTVLLVAALAAILGWGWQHLWFQCDDAYINFRYSANAYLGRGLTWNPEPFLPVEGYTAPLWVVLLWWIWEATGIEPPRTATVVTLAAGAATLLLIWRWLYRLPLPPAVAAHRRAIAAAALLGIACQRTFLTWLSSGMETAVFGLLLTAWLWLLTTPAERIRRRTLWGMCVLATLTYFTRPEGLLAVAATLAWFLWTRRRRPGELLTLLPFLAVPAHFLWRHAHYGAWLPNTFHAKNVGAWPESGARYLASFVVENGVWLWALVAAAAGAAALARGRLRLRPGTTLAAATLVVHAGYYTFVTGGDYFEYRVYAHLVPLLMLATPWLAAHIVPRPAAAIGAVVAYALAAQPIAWLQHACGAPVATHVPAPLQPVAAAYDGWQAWLRDHHVGIRRDHHADLARRLLDKFPSRAEGALVADDHPVMIGAAVGVLGWVFPHVAILDTYGLNDWVVARNPTPRPRGQRAFLLQRFAAADADGDGVLSRTEAVAFAAGDAAADRLLADFDFDRDGRLTREDLDRYGMLLEERQMAHDRTPPAGYFEGFRPNVEVVGGRAVVTPRSPPLTAAAIAAHELEFRRRFP